MWLVRIPPLPPSKFTDLSVSWSRYSLVRKRYKLLKENGFSTSCVAASHQHPFVPSSQVRKTFLDFFSNQHNHQLVPSSPVRLRADPSLLFVNAGMNQFKPIFLGTADPDSPLKTLSRVANSQKCIRAGGKHNDLDDVGRDGYHHTFFEMLGNWSFADYFKKEACQMAWELLTEHYGIPTDRLYVTYFAGDPSTGLQADLDCKEIWLEIGVPSDRILPFGVSDNFWDMGDTGPCGPCTEIHYDHTGGQQVSHLVNAGTPDVTEIWNLVFMQYERLADKSLVPLPSKHVDTGMGLERLTAVLNGSQSNYDTDLFQPLFATLHVSSKVRPYGGLMGSSDSEGIDRAYRVVADHARMAAVSIADGIHPDVISSAKIVRRVIRRGALLARNVLKCPPGVLGSLAEEVANILGDAFPEMRTHISKITDVINEEEREYMIQIEKGINVFEDMAAKARSTKIFPGQDMFHLYYVCGLPEELLVDLIRTHDLQPEMGEFHKLVNKNKAQSKKAAVFNQKQYDEFINQQGANILSTCHVAFTDDSPKYSYDDTGNASGAFVLTSNAVALWSSGKFVNEIASGNKGVVILDQTNFYSEAGGQPCDLGFITQENGVFQVEDVQLLHGFVQHYGTVVDGSIQTNSSSDLAINQERRLACMRNHTATHILNEVIHQTVKSSRPRSFYSGHDYLKMDFTLEDKHLLTIEEIAKVESAVNDIIRKNLRVSRIVLPQAEAVKLPNIKMLDGESYPSKMSVVSVRTKPTSGELSFSSLEACCGTHVRSTEDIGQFVITSQKAIIQTQRRLRAVTGSEAFKVITRGKQLANDFQALKISFEQLVADTPEEEIQEDDLKAIDKGIRNIRTAFKDEATPYIMRITLEPELELLQRFITRRLRKKSKAATARKQVLQE